MSYDDFLQSKNIMAEGNGLSDIPPLNGALFPFQCDITRWALRRGRSCIFADCGMGKTLMQLEWAHHVPGKVLILAPLAVTQQTIREAEKFSMRDVAYSHDGTPSTHITITNYERLDRFDPSDYTGIVLDESSILKSYTGKFRTAIIESFRETPFRLACTATPAPNDFMELGNHSEFVGAMTRTEMLAMFFVHDGGETQKWRLKGHAESEFWRWLCSWAVMLRFPSDLGYDDDGFVLPSLDLHHVKVEHGAPLEGDLFPMEALTLQDRQAARRESTAERVAACAELVKATSGPWVIWCNLNVESHELTKAIPGAVEVCGSDSQEHKESSMLGFSGGDIRVLVTKPSIAGFGMNWQHCANVAFVGLSDSYEQFYQAIRRCWRFGQTRSVQCHIITADTEGAVVRNIERKEQDAQRMGEMMVEHMKDINANNIRGTGKSETQYKECSKSGDGWDMVLGDCVDAVSMMDDDSVHYSIFSPPFASLYTYSDSTRDMGNVRDDEEFAKHFHFLIPELFRVMMPGRLLSFHCMNLPTSKCRDGVIGLKDFRGDLIRMFMGAGFIYHSEVVIWKDPVTAMQRTKALGLLHKQLVKDSCMSRQGIPDYLVTMRKPGENSERVEGELGYFHGDQSTFQNSGRLSIDVWQKYASPIWDDINMSNTLQKHSARAEKDERHICPLQLDVIHRGIQLWTNPGDLVLSPFAGIGSEGYEAIKMGRRFIGVELKESYWRQAVDNLRAADIEAKSDLLFDNHEIIQS